MATMKDIYSDLKTGWEFYEDFGNYTSPVLFIGTCDRWGSPSYGKDYIYWSSAGSSAETVSFKNLCWVISNIFKCNANEFYKRFKKR